MALALQAPLSLGRHGGFARAFALAVLLGVSLYVVRKVKSRSRKTLSKLVVALDFDETLTCMHASGAATSPEMLDRRFILSNIKDREFLVQFCAAARRRGHTLAIVSRSDARDGGCSGRELVKRYLREAFHPGGYADCFPDDLIVCHNAEYDAETPGGPAHAGKNAHLRRVRETVMASRTDGESVQLVLVDDQAGNVEAAALAGHSAYCCGEAGFTREYYDRCLRLQKELGLVVEPPPAQLPRR
eukprot:Rhum_TRINITY_DN15212_c3_g1::Rhum_TRINITY_DN15212_c3_g1_i1::g.144835::m.144835